MTSQPHEPQASGVSRSENVVNLQALSDLFDLARRSTPKETRPERQSRLESEKTQSDHDRSKELLVLYFTAATVGAMTLVAFVVVLVPFFPDEIRKWGALSLTSILSMSVGYINGRSAK